jgi:hypothetical protein
LSITCRYRTPILAFLRTDIAVAKLFSFHGRTAFAIAQAANASYIARADTAEAADPSGLDGIVSMHTPAKVPTPAMSPNSARGRRVQRPQARRSQQ